MRRGFSVGKSTLKERNVAHRASVTSSNVPSIGSTRGLIHEFSDVGLNGRKNRFAEKATCLVPSASSDRSAGHHSRA